MEGSGRRSAASLGVAMVSAWAPLEAPQALTEAERAMWDEIVTTKPGEWFAADCAPLLEAYCRTTTQYRRAVAALAEVDPGTSAFGGLAKVVAIFGSQLATLSTKLRLTPQSRYGPKAAYTANGKAGGPVKPWQRAS